MAHNILLLPDQENQERRGSLQGPIVPLGVYKRQLKNVPSSESKRKALTAITNYQEERRGGLLDEEVSECVLCLISFSLSRLFLVIWILFTVYRLQYRPIYHRLHSPLPPRFITPSPRSPHLVSQRVSESARE